MNSESSLFGTLEQLLRNQPDVLGLFLTGSYADLTADLWSDLDALIVVSADAFCKYSACLDWLSPLGAFFAHETTPIENGLAVTIRLCLMSFQRFDLTYLFTGLKAS